MKQFFAFVKKEFYHILRDRRTMLIVLGIPIVEIILFGFAISTEVKNVRVTILDPSKDVATQRQPLIHRRRQCNDRRRYRKGIPEQFDRPGDRFPGTVQ